jgi:hypothetical protein
MVDFMRHGERSSIVSGCDAGSHELCLGSQVKRSEALWGHNLARDNLVDGTSMTFRLSV